MSTSQVILKLLCTGDVFGLLPEPYNHMMLPRQSLRSFVRRDLWGQHDDPM